MTPKGGAREGAGRPARPNTIRNNVQLERWVWKRLGEPRHYSEGIVKSVIKNMTEPEKMVAAEERLEELGFNGEQISFCFHEYPNMGAQLDWLLTASKKDITDWGKATDWKPTRIYINSQYKAK